MPQRHLFSLRFAHALREACITEPYNRKRFSRDLLAGITVGIIAIPLSMALAIASGVPPQHGLYTAMIAGFIIALAGGSRLSISGPTAAFVVILAPITHSYGLAGLMMATLMAGLMLMGIAWARQGRLIEYISESVTLGFTAGIAVVIATLQLKDLLGLQVADMPEHFLAKVEALAIAMPSAAWPSVLVGGITLAVLLSWKRLGTPLPAHLPAVIVGSLLAWWLNSAGWQVDTIGSRFSYLLPDGSSGQGIPPLLPSFTLPWLQPGANGQPFELSWRMLLDLFPSAFAIAMLGAIESLLCAVVLDGMTGRRHSANSELMAQGLGNIVTPFFGGISATAALARSAANVRAGGETPVAGMVHALVVLAAVIALAPLLAYLPMPAMAAMLLVVAWNMSEAPKALHLVKTAPRGDILVFLTCFSLTVVFDMVIAITVGVVLAAVLFMREIAQMTRLTEISTNSRFISSPLAPGWQAYRITGPLFFAAADRIFAELAFATRDARGVILYLEAVPLLDAGGLSALVRFIESSRKSNTRVYFVELQFQPLKTLARARIQPVEGVSAYFASLDDAVAAIARD
jgi:SulP family sulfate permease